MKPLDCIGVDPTKVDVGKRDFQPCLTEPIVHGEGQVPVPNPKAPEEHEAG